jgi:N-hydroxyarylamine O-acetyltransferase
LPEGDVKDISGHYRIGRRSNESFELKKENEKDWETQYIFSINPRKFSDSAEMCNFQQDSPSSHFRTRMLCTIATEQGRITLSNNSLTINESGNKTKIEFETPDEFSFYLKKCFGIVL